LVPALQPASAGLQVYLLAREARTGQTQRCAYVIPCRIAEPAI